LELQLRIEYNIVSRAAWGILKDQSEDILGIVLSTLHRCAITWTPEDDLSMEMAEASESELGDEEFGNWTPTGSLSYIVLLRPILRKLNVCQ
jgi:hypothetical protein